MTTDSTTPFWPNKEHWSVAIPLQTPHYRMPALEKDGFVILRPMDVNIPSNEWESLEYMDWKSGGDTNFAPLASADGELDCRGFWDKARPTKTRSGHQTLQRLRRSRNMLMLLAQTLGEYASSNSNRKIATSRFVRSIVTTTIGSTPTTKVGLCVHGSNSPINPTATCC